MSAERPLEIDQLRVRLHYQYDGPLPEAAHGSPEQREANFLSRALAAYAIQHLSQCTREESVDAVVDGGMDGGIDAIHYAPTVKILWIVQSKFDSDGKQEPALGDVAKYKVGIENLIQSRLEVFSPNPKWAERLAFISTLLDDEELQVRAALVYTSNRVLSHDRVVMIEDLHTRFSAGTEFLQIQSYNLTSIHGWLTGADAGRGVPDAELHLYKPGHVTEPYETIYGLLSLRDLAALYRLHGRRLIAENIRAYKGDTDVNQQILATAAEEPLHFFYLNNGLTACCDRLNVPARYRGNHEEKVVRVHGFSIVNGAQTMGTIAKYLDGGAQEEVVGYVFIKVISLEQCDDDEEFRERITRSTNFQNQVGLRDFVTLDEQQDAISRQLTLSGINYHYKKGDDTPGADAENFDLDEATTALACLHSAADCDFCARTLANRESLLSMESVYPAADLLRSRYARLFRPDVSARTTWRAVQAQRIMLERMRDNGRTSQGVRKAFYETARWVLLSVIYLRLRPQLGEALTLTADEEQSVSRATLDMAELLWEVCEAQGIVTRRVDAATNTEVFDAARHFRSVFSSAADCARLRAALLGRLA
jgi:AIPR protein